MEINSGTVRERVFYAMENNKRKSIKITLFSTRQVAELLGCNIRTVQRYIDYGELKAARPFRSYVIEPCELMKFIDAKGF
ncbi:MAG: helix-turn-helix domain-containing protein [Geovibrio sp.]|jgi:excisionase family DNA binding protein|nr:helix-turn-helix domain-containing protein [Geovibrio sp.]